MSESDGKPKRKLPERSDSLKLPIDFDDAVKAALETKPPPAVRKKKQRKKRGS